LKFITSLIEGLHYTIGIRTPPPEQLRKIAIIWLVSIVVIVGTIFLLLKYAF
jgi:hypothetical protein